MDWRTGQDDFRRRYLARCDAAEVARYEALVGRLTREDEDAHLADLAAVLDLREGMTVLDAGAGAGALCGVLLRVPGLRITALEPAPAMLAALRAKSGLAAVTAVEGFCDAAADRRHFGAGQFDAILSRQLVNGLYDPLAAFRNWHAWLAPGGVAVILDGLYTRDAWSGPWQEDVDVLPLSACQSMAMAPYLLEAAGFRIEAVKSMDAVNALPATRTKRYLVLARKAADGHQFPKPDTARPGADHESER